METVPNMFATQERAFDPTLEVESLQSVINKHIAKAMQAVDGNMGHAAKLLGISRRSLYRWRHKYGEEFGFQLARKPESR